MKNFDIEEFACPCCGEAKMDAVFLSAIDRARDVAGVPFVINSGYRCASHNEAVGGKPTSSHTRGMAADIKAVDSRSRFKIMEALVEVGFNRIGVANSFIHADVDDSKSPDVMWVYK